MYFESPALLPGHAREQPRERADGGGRRGVEPDVGDDDLPRVEAARRHDEPELRPVERDGEVGLHGGSGHLPRRGVDPGGEVDRDHGRAARVDPLDRRGRLGTRRAAEPRAEEGVDHDVGARGVVGLDRLAALLAQDARRDPPVAPVRAAAADDREAPRGGIGPDRLRGDGGARAFHQLAGRLRVAGVPLLGGAHLRGGEERLVHRGQGRGRRWSGEARSATAVAAATVCECVSETSSSRIPTRSANASVFPASVTPGFGGPTISISFHVKRTPQPSALPTASLPQKRAA